MIISYQNFIGIDIGKFKNVAAVHNQKNTIKFDNDTAGWQQLFQNFSNILPNSFVTLENTGKYELGLAHFLVDKNVAVHRANTRKVKSFILSHGTLAKSDQSDARALAQYGFERYSTLSPFVPMSKEQTALVAFCQRRDDITQMRAQEKCRLKAPENDYIKESCQKTIDFFNSQINELNNAIQKIIDESIELQKRQKILKTVPGIGKKLSQDFVCLMPELGYLNKKEVASLAGVAPHPKESGKSIGYRSITGGRSNVRAKLFTAAMTAARSKSSLGVFYSDLIGRGKKKMVAITALMRKIIVIANARLKEAVNMN
ncbi:IS110 family transposase [Wolbachia endosymbiont of Diaphorina citri]|jgi:Transposase and inactivated derivatives|uniref:IS110 family transposase n=1 Tax=Wolbachia endosymbiont of Diaphorina citri TaxID=116598 RepID=UPI0002E52E0E|nr:IS110 family transposase [Wolbachia endosymbiont of Diaphorina citri]QJT94328.1 IS110 family transposase [Wolbachia endosymbiont of Diaphorina citri]QJT95568.1 IS110 family transposase [Wolbachia endosymbiont of Diaphorina citri]QJT96930.1 IS110 family transposase [Wolbachia endosymbiont of Diaphorina citri]QLK11226.1 IS110 family transposase [Wolbachia endosymbiont of Diaphorina citri]QXY87241.1 IS110 family transposase [Wolbachia endosymbiont of Diaphorina citri]